MEIILQREATVRKIVPLRLQAEKPGALGRRGRAGRDRPEMASRAQRRDEVSKKRPERVRGARPGLGTDVLTARGRPPDCQRAEGVFLRGSNPPTAAPGASVEESCRGHRGGAAEQRAAHQPVRQRPGGGAVRTPCVAPLRAACFEHWYISRTNRAYWGVRCYLKSSAFVWTYALQSACISRLTSSARYSSPFGD
jgi:hypothetical protein